MQAVYCIYIYISLEETTIEAGIREWRATKSLLAYFTTTISNIFFLLNEIKIYDLC